MFTSLLGIRLILLLGKTVPLPASYDVMSALSRVQVTIDDEQGDGFQITFTLGKDSSQDYSLLRGGTFDPLTRVVIGVLMGASPEVLIDGVITHHQVAPSDDPGMSTLTVSGQDVSLMLKLKEKNDKFENQPDSVIVTRVIARYAQYGLIPQVTPTTNIPLEIEYIPRQNESDLEYVQRLAGENGFVFYIEPKTFGVSTAYWGKENRLGIPQPVLAINMGPHTNTTELNFSQDGLAPVSPEGSFIEPITKISIPIPPLPSLRLPPFAANPTPPARTTIMRQTANQNPLQAALSALAAATDAPDSVSGEGKLDTVRYGHVLKPRRLVGVAGAGLSYDGVHYVKGVTHRIERGSYIQEFRLSREGTGTLLPVLPT